MCTTTRAAGARLTGRAAAGELHPPPSHAAAADACAAKVAAHSEAYERALGDGAAEEADWSEPVRRLPLRELVVDPAVVIFLLMHVLAAATPWWYGGVRRQDVGITVASYIARMFGARPSPPPWVAKARPVALRLRRLTQAVRGPTGITAGFHRLLSHRSFQTSRPTQVRRRAPRPPARCKSSTFLRPARRPGNAASFLRSAARHTSLVRQPRARAASAAACVRALRADAGARCWRLAVCARVAGDGQLAEGAAVVGKPPPASPPHR